MREGVFAYKESLARLKARSKTAPVSQNQMPWTVTNHRRAQIGLGRMKMAIDCMAPDNERIQTLTGTYPIRVQMLMCRHKMMMMGKSNSLLVELCELVLVISQCRKELSQHTRYLSSK